MDVLGGRFGVHYCCHHCGGSHNCGQNMTVTWSKLSWMQNLYNHPSSTLYGQPDMYLAGYNGQMISMRWRHEM